MDFYSNPYMSLPGVTTEELTFLQQATAELSENQQKHFYMIYTGKRKSAQDLLIFTLLGFFGAAGIQRFLVGQIGMGILYFFTGGLCVIGTIVDLVNIKKMTNDYNQQQAFEVANMIKMIS